jgi:hypothetical protein
MSCMIRLRLRPCRGSERRHIGHRNAPIRLRALGGNPLDYGASPLPVDATGPRPIPVWHPSRCPETVGSTLAVLIRARRWIADEQRWYRGSFARTWLDIPAPPQSALAGRFCAIGAVMRRRPQGRLADTGRLHRARMADSPSY